MNTTFFYNKMRSLLFRMESETAHRVTLELLNLFRYLPSPLFYRSPFRSSPGTLMGLRFENPVGLAAGFDKDGDFIDTLALFGFGFIEVGTTTPRPQPGNPKPRLFRIPEKEALINRMGFNNKGVDYLVSRIKGSSYKGVIGVNIGKNVFTPIERAVDDYRYCLKKVYPIADYITINISSPNTPGLRNLQQGEDLEALIDSLCSERKTLSESYSKYVPLAVKIAPDLSDPEIATIADTINDSEIDAIIATNTTIARPGIDHLPLARQDGGLSGAPLRKQSTAILRSFHRLLRKDIVRIASGGVCSGQDAKEKKMAGADLVQVYTGLVFRGPFLVKAAASGMNETTI